MALDLKAIAEAAADLIATTSGNAVHAYWHMIDKHEYPAALIAPADPFVTYHETFGTNALCSVDFNVTLEVAAVDPESAVIAMYELLSSGTDMTSSVFDALESDRTLGGTAQTSWVELASAPAVVESAAGRTVLTSSLLLHVMERRG